MERINNLEQLNMIYDQDKTLKELGLWSTPLLKDKYAYRLSPDYLSINENERKELQEIAETIYGKGGYLEGSLKLIQKTNSQQFVGTIVGGAIKKALTNNIPKEDIAMQQIGPEQLPFISRLDLVKVLRGSDSEPSFQIVEVEGDKTHGFGYLSLMDLFREKYYGRKDTVGIIDSLIERLNQKEIDRNTPILLIVGRSERFYVTELEVFALLANKKGLNITTTIEDDIRINGDHLEVMGKNNQFKTLINIPSLTPNGFTGSGINQGAIKDLYIKDELEVLIPPKRTLGSKGLLGIVANGDNDPEVEEVLKDCFDPSLLAKLRKFIPQTFVVSKRNAKLAEKIFTEDPDSWVIKQTVASGMKGVALPSDKIKREDFLIKAINSPFNYILQRKVMQETREFSFSEPFSLSQMKRASMYMRVEVFASTSGIVTIGITGRESPSVHGAKDCIQIPVIFT